MSGLGQVALPRDEALQEAILAQSFQDAMEECESLQGVDLLEAAYLSGSQMTVRRWPINGDWQDTLDGLRS